MAAHAGPPDARAGGAADSGAGFEDSIDSAYGLLDGATSAGFADAGHVLDATAFWATGGGVRRYLLVKHAWLTGGGWRHSVVAPVSEAPFMRACGGVPIPCSGGYRWVVGRGRAQRLIEAAQPDLIESADPYQLGRAALAAAQRLRVPAIAFCHSDLPSFAARCAGGRGGALPSRHDPALARWARRRAQAWLARLYEGFDLVLAPSQTMVQRLRALGLRHVRHQPLGVDTALFTPAARDDEWRDALERRLGVAPGTRLLLYAGRFGAEKNLPLLAEAVRRLGPGHLLLAIGGGPRPPQGAQVRVLAPEPAAHRLAKLMANVDCFVHAGDQETFGLAVLEAMACGLPVAVARHGALPELVGAAGLVVARQRPQEWAEALRLLLAEDGARRAAMSRTRALAHDWAPVMRQLEARYRSLTQRHGGTTVPDLRHAA